MIETIATIALFVVLTAIVVVAWLLYDMPRQMWLGDREKM